MRILLAIDGSAPAAVALELVDHIAWPAGSVIRVAAALEHGSDLVGNPHIPPLHAASANAAPAELEAASGGGTRDAGISLARRYDEALDAAVLDLDEPGRTVERILLRGRPASSVIEEAESFGADRIVVGHRGHGRLPSMLLGSVSAEIVDHAHCPVLVARRSTVGSILLAADGSRGAEQAERFLLQYPVFGEAPVRVVSVAEVGMPWSTGMSPGVYDQVIESYTEAVDVARSECKAIAAAAASRLADAGYQAVGDAPEGDPATEIVAAATDLGIGLIVTGTRGHRGLTRMILGSTARKLLVHAPCSVLIVRESARIGTAEGAAEAPAGG